MEKKGETQGGLEGNRRDQERGVRAGKNPPTWKKVQLKTKGVEGGEAEEGLNPHLGLEEPIHASGG